VSSSFPVTRWSLVAAAGADDRHSALRELCAAYWEPLYTWLRRSGHDPEQASDLLAAFVARLLEKGDVATADSGKGRFRAYLLGALKHFVANERARDRALKRGGGAVPFSLDAAGAETRLSLEPAHDETPERAYERRWALAIVERARGRLAGEQRRAGRAEAWEALAVYLSGDEGRPSYAETAAVLGRSEGAVKVAVHRLRRRFGELLREEVAETLSDPGEVEAEIGLLLDALSR
jgi:RNA polymerase sigma-70 factor (ECF subfamily)